MRLPTIEGTIRRRILVNFRVDPQVMQRQLPCRFRPKLHRGYAIAGICLIRLEHMRPKIMPEAVGLSSENAAHRVAVLWDEEGSVHEGVFICRRDTDSQINHLLGGRIFPGEHHYAQFHVTECDPEITLSMKSADGTVAIGIEGAIASELPSTSIFGLLAEASSFFEGGALGYSVTRDPQRLDGLRLETQQWRVEPLEIRHVYSSFFAGEERFPRGSVAFDHALIMRDVAHQWHEADDLYI